MRTTHSLALATVAALTMIGGESSLAQPQPQPQPQPPQAQPPQAQPPQQPAPASSLEQVQAAFDRARAHFGNGDFAAAALEFENAFRARNLPQFLFNIGAAHESVRDYASAVSYYERYLAAIQDPAETRETTTRVLALKRELERLAAKPAGSPPDSTPSPELQGLPALTIRGAVIIESQPDGALVYVDNRDTGAVGRTPLNTLLNGEHRIIVAKEGFKPVEHGVTVLAGTLVTLTVPLEKQATVAVVSIDSNIPGSDIYIDDRGSAAGKTPWKGELGPGKHAIWVTKDGYSTYEVEVNVVAGQPRSVSATLKGSPVGYVNVVGADSDQQRIYANGEILCERGPCRKSLPQGRHTITIRRDGHKEVSRTVEIRGETETKVEAKLNEEPGRLDAIVAWGMTAMFLAGAIYTLDRANGLRDDLEEQINQPAGGVTNRDNRFVESKVWAGTGHGLLGLGVMGGAFALYYTFRDKGGASLLTTETKPLTVAPSIGPNYAGVGVGGSF